MQLRAIERSEQKMFERYRLTGNLRSAPTSTTTDKQTAAEEQAALVSAALNSSRMAMPLDSGKGTDQVKIIIIFASLLDYILLLY